MSFQNFPKLLAEIRIVIWTFALPGPQLITICTRKLINPTDIEPTSEAGPRIYRTIKGVVDHDLVIHGAMEGYRGTISHFQRVESHCGQKFPTSFRQSTSISYLLQRQYRHAILRKLQCRDIVSEPDGQATSPADGDFQWVTALAIVFPCGMEPGVPNFIWHFRDCNYIFAMSRLFSKAKNVLFVNRSPAPIRDYHLLSNLEFLRDQCTQSLYILLGIGFKFMKASGSEIIDKLPPLTRWMECSLLDGLHLLHDENIIGESVVSSLALNN